MTRTVTNDCQPDAGMLFSLNTDSDVIRAIQVAARPGAEPLEVTGLSFKFFFQLGRLAVLAMPVSDYRVVQVIGLI